MYNVQVTCTCTLYIVYIQVFNLEKVYMYSFDNKQHMHTCTCILTLVVSLCKVLPLKDVPSLEMWQASQHSLSSVRVESSHGIEDSGSHTLQVVCVCVWGGGGGGGCCREGGEKEREIGGGVRVGKRKS